MEDPHVVALFYQITTEEGFSYENPAQVAVSQPTVDGELTEGRFVARMRHHFATEREARMQVDPYLRAWELNAALQRGRAEMRFVFDHADVIERAPLLPGEARAFCRGVAAVVGMSGSLKMH